MNAPWLTDARKIPDDVMSYLRRIAVRAVEEKQHSPELVAEILGISRSSLYDWLRWYHTDGEAALNSRASPGAARVITPEMDRWLKETTAHSTPADHGYSAAKWTIKILADVLKKQFAIDVGNSTVGLHLHQMHITV